MPRRTARYRKRRHVAAFLLAVGLMLVGVILWRVLQSRPLEPSPTQVRSQADRPASAPPAGEEDFSAGERQGLEEILKRHGAGQPQ